MIAAVRAARLTCLLLAASTLPGCGGGSGWFPLEPGRVLTYRQSVRILNDTSTQKYVVADIGPTEVSGVRLFERRVQRTGRRFYRRKDDGVYRFRAATKDDRPGRGSFAEELMLPLPAEPGRTWSLDSRLRLIESRTFAAEDKLRPLRLPVRLAYRIAGRDATVKVPAGRFAGCLHVRATGRTTVPVDRRNAEAEVTVEHQDWYAPGVGLVKSERTETSESVFLEAGRYTLELESLHE